MGLIRLSLVTLVGLGAGMYYFGDDQGTSLDPIGRDISLQAAFFPDLSSPNDAEVASALMAALESDSSPETKTVMGAAMAAPAPAVQPANKPSPAKTFADPEAQLIKASLTVGDAPSASRAPTPVTQTATLKKPDTPPLLYVTGSFVNVRTAPTINAAILSSLSQGTAVQDLGQAEGSWREIMLIDSGAKGYMSGDFLSEQAPR